MGAAGTGRAAAGAGAAPPMTGARPGAAAPPHARPPPPAPVPGTECPVAGPCLHRPSGPRAQVWARAPWRLGGPGGWVWCATASPTLTQRSKWTRTWAAAEGAGPVAALGVGARAGAGAVEGAGPVAALGLGVREGPGPGLGPGATVVWRLPLGPRVLGPVGTQGRPLLRWRRRWRRTRREWTSSRVGPCLAASEGPRCVLEVRTLVRAGASLADVVCVCLASFSVSVSVSVPVSVCRPQMICALHDPPPTHTHTRWLGMPLTQALVPPWTRVGARCRAQAPPHPPATCPSGY